LIGCAELCSISVIPILVDALAIALWAMAGTALLAAMFIRRAKR
jgi:hypothetical protein